MARRLRKRSGATPAEACVSADACGSAVGDDVEALCGDPYGSTLARCLRTRSLAR